MDSGKGYIHRLNTALSNTFNFLLEDSQLMVIVQLFVTESISVINVSDNRIMMTPYLKSEGNTRFWSKYLATTTVFLNLQQILEHFSANNNTNPIYRIWKKHEEPCKFIMVQWICILEVYFVHYLNNFCLLIYSI